MIRPIPVTLSAITLLLPGRTGVDAPITTPFLAVLDNKDARMGELVGVWLDAPTRGPHRPLASFEVWFTTHEQVRAATGVSLPEETDLALLDVERRHVLGQAHLELGAVPPPGRWHATRSITGPEHDEVIAALVASIQRAFEAALEDVPWPTPVASPAAGPQRWAAHGAATCQNTGCGRACEGDFAREGHSCGIGHVDSELRRFLIRL